jgi:hypothetical protein
MTGMHEYRHSPRGVQAARRENLPVVLRLETDAFRADEQAPRPRPSLNAIYVMARGSPMELLQHVFASFSGPISYVIQGPAHHQIHHSTKAAHVGKNLGFTLALWDWLFGTLYLPREREKLEFGVGAEPAKQFGAAALSCRW